MPYGKPLRLKRLFLISLCVLFLLLMIQTPKLHAGSDEAADAARDSADAAHNAADSAQEAVDSAQDARDQMENAPDEAKDAADDALNQAESARDSADDAAQAADDADGCSRSVSRKYPFRKGGNLSARIFLGTVDDRRDPRGRHSRADLLERDKRASGSGRSCDRGPTLPVIPYVLARSMDRGVVTSRKFASLQLLRNGAQSTIGNVVPRRPRAGKFPRG